MTSTAPRGPCDQCRFLSRPCKLEFGESCKACSDSGRKCMVNKAGVNECWTKFIAETPNARSTWENSQMTSQGSHSSLAKAAMHKAADAAAQPRASGSSFVNSLALGASILQSSETSNDDAVSELLEQLTIEKEEGTTDEMDPAASSQPAKKRKNHRGGRKKKKAPIVDSSSSSASEWKPSESESGDEGNDARIDQSPLRKELDQGAGNLADRLGNAHLQPTVEDADDEVDEPASAGLINNTPKRSANVAAPAYIDLSASTPPLSPSAEASTVSMASSSPAPAPATPTAAATVDPDLAHEAHLLLYSTDRESFKARAKNRSYPEFADTTERLKKWRQLEESFDGLSPNPNEPGLNPAEYEIANPGEEFEKFKKYQKNSVKALCCRKVQAMGNSKRQYNTSSMAELFFISELGHALPLYTFPPGAVKDWIQDSDDWKFLCTDLTEGMENEPTRYFSLGYTKLEDDDGVHSLVELVNHDTPRLVSGGECDEAFRNNKMLGEALVRRSGIQAKCAVHKKEYLVIHAEYLPGRK